MLQPLHKILLLLLLLADLATRSQAEEVCSAADTTCADCRDNKPASNECPYWADNGECFKNPIFMEVECRKSCEICGSQRGADHGIPQVMASDHYQVTESQVSHRFGYVRSYLKNWPYNDLKGLCRNQDELCTVWAVAGECDKNPEFMNSKCAAACRTCDDLSIETRCPIDPNAPKAWVPGDLNKMFERLTTEPYLSQYSVDVLSRDPWVITMENVVLPEEAQRLIQLGGLEGYQLSHEVGKLQADGNYQKDYSQERRTSTNAWCQSDCYNDEMAQRVVNRLSNITGINERNSEYLQLLRYSEGQLYVVHHDYIVHHLERQQGVRILTMYLYLNDVEAGGGTNFDLLNITVMPKQGRALLWPSVLNEDPNHKDGRTTHQALPVEKGLKFGANAWFHMYDFKTPNSNNCHS